MKKFMTFNIYVFVIIIMWFLLQPLFWALGLLFGWLLPPYLATFGKLIAVVFISLGIIGSIKNEL